MRDSSFIRRAYRRTILMREVGVSFPELIKIQYLYLLAPELIHASKGMGVLVLKVMPQ